MGSSEAYEAGLEQRLEELRKGDPAYKAHERSIFEALVYSIDNFGRPGAKNHRILDVGCGLGFMTQKLTEDYGSGVLGIDVSKKAIQMAKTEHAKTKFEATSVQDMARNKKGAFEYAILNMVLHSLDYGEAKKVLLSTRECLKEAGVVIVIVPADKWAIKKLVEYAQDVGMNKKDGIAWIKQKLLEGKVELPVKIAQGKYYPEPITIYYRDLNVYASIFSESNFGVGEATYNVKNELISEEILPFYSPRDYMMIYELSDVHHDRHTLISTSLPDDWREGKWRKIKTK